jgi:mannose/fructose/N-acetylgalactosamine-specific phosphotransferase system component IID
MPQRRLRDDDRGLALAVVIFFAMLVIGALLFAIMNVGMTEVFAISQNMSSSPGATDQTNLLEAIWDGMLFAVLVIAMLFLLARAVREGRGP